VAARAGPSVPPPGNAALGALAALGSATAAWSLALLLGPTAAAVKTVCGADEGGGCSALWRTPFALAVQRTTGVSVAGWGVVWGLAAMALAIIALVQVARGRASAAVLTGLRFLSAAGLLAVFVLAGVAFSERTFCKACAVVYVLAAVHAAIALFAWRARGLPDAARGAMLAASFLLGAYVVTAFLPAAPLPLAAAIPQAPPPADTTRDAALREFVSSLAPPARQALSDVLDRMRTGPSLTLPSARALRGSPDAPVRFTEFTDVRCSHCAELHPVWDELERALPPGSFSLESRFYPLDAACNAQLRPGRVPDLVRCVAPKAQICMEGRPGAQALAGALFAEQSTLTVERVYTLASAHAPRAELEACAASPETARKLADDVALAARYEPEGTPVVLVNGRRGAAFPPFLYAIVLARGWPDHPGFAGLPSPRPDAHIH
jgi:serine/threonine-protein kinase